MGNHHADHMMLVYLQKLVIKFVDQQRLLSQYGSTED
jgi:hypothetical protein